MLLTQRLCVTEGGQQCCVSPGNRLSPNEARQAITFLLYAHRVWPIQLLLQLCTFAEKGIQESGVLTTEEECCRLPTNVLPFSSEQAWC